MKSKIVLIEYVEKSNIRIESLFLKRLGVLNLEVNLEQYSGLKCYFESDFVISEQCRKHENVSQL